MEPKPTSFEPKTPQTSLAPDGNMPVDEKATAPEVSTEFTESSLEVPTTEPLTSLPSTPSEPLSAATTSEPAPAVAGWSATPTSAAVTPTGTKSKKPAKLLVMIAAAVVLLGAGSAAAYLGVVVPNKPENVLQSAIVNTLQQPQVNFKGTIDADASGTAAKATFSGSSDSAKKAADVQFGVTVSGIDVSLEARLVDKNIYFKAGDLSTLATMASSFAPDYAAPATAISKALSNKWVVVDSTLLKTAGVDCVLDSSWTLTKDDVKLLQDQYKQHPFTTITSSAGDTLDGKHVQKYELSLDNNKIADYGNNLNNLSSVKKLDACQKGSANAKMAKAKGDGKHTPITVWVDKGSKRIVKIGYKSSSKDATSVNGSGSVTLSYEKVNITAPEGATPLLQVIASLQSSFSSLGLDLSQLTAGGDSASSPSPSTSSNANDTKRQADISSVQVQLEAFYSENGYYPSRTDMNSGAWLATNMKSLDTNALVDPSNPAKSKILVVSPVAGSYAYAVTDATGKSCEADDTNCAQYTLTATYESPHNGASTYSKSSLN